MKQEQEDNEKEGFAQPGEPYHASVHTYESISKHKTLSIDITEQTTFTTQRKHREGSVRRSCLAFVEHLRLAGYECVPLEEAENTFSQLLDKWDRLTLKAYFGSRKGKSQRHMRRYARYVTGTVSIKDITMDQPIPERKGYLERLGLVEYEKHGPVWFMLLKEPSLVPEFTNSVSNSEVSNGVGKLGLSSTSVREGSQQSIANLSLTPMHFAEHQADEPSEATNIETAEKERECYRVRDKIFGDGTPTLDFLKAVPCESKPLPKIVWPKSKEPGG